MEARRICNLAVARSQCAENITAAPACQAGKADIQNAAKDGAPKRLANDPGKRYARHGGATLTPVHVSLNRNNEADIRHAHAKTYEEGRGDGLCRGRADVKRNQQKTAGNQY